MIDVFAHPVLEAATHGDVVEDRKVLNVFAESHSAGVWAYWHTELRGHEHHGQRLIDAGHAATVELQEADGLRLQKLLEQDPVLADLASGEGHRGDGPGDRGVGQDGRRAERKSTPL